MTTLVSEQTRRAAKDHDCQMCGVRISKGTLHRASVFVWDARIYTWRECSACGRDEVLDWVWFSAGCPDEGVGTDSASEWADEAVTWSKSGAERWAARSWLARAAMSE